MNSTYDDTTSWRRNLFKVPTGKAGQEFIEEVTKCINHFSYNTALEPITLKLAMIAFPLLLQKPSSKSKASQHTEHLKRRIEIWKAGKLCELLRECKEIQRRLIASKNHEPPNADRVFARLMLQGKVSAALRWIGSSRTSVRECNEDTLAILKSLHPNSHEMNTIAALQGPELPTESVVFDEIDGDSIQFCIKRISGAAGPSGADAEMWLRILCSKQFKEKPSELAEAVASCARKRATTYIRLD